MSDISNKFFQDKVVGALWDVAVSIKRGNPLPLDRDAVVHNLSELEALKTSAVTYPGQIVAVIADAVMEGEVVITPETTTLYYFDHNLDYHKVGQALTGDSKTIEVSAEGAIGLLGAAGAGNGTLPMIGEDGTLTWRTLEEIGAGDGNDNTTYEFSFANEKITVTPKHNGIAQNAVELDLSTFVTADELAVELGKLTDTTYSVAVGEKVLKLNDTVFSTEIGLKHENGMISLTGINGEVIAEFSDADFIKDSVLENVEYNAETQQIVFTWNTVNGQTKTDSISVADFVQTYAAGNGLELTGNSFAVKVDGESEGFLTVGANGVKLAGVQTAIDNAKQAAIDDAATKYATTGALTQLETTLDGRLDTLEAIDHTLLATKEEVNTSASNAQTAIDNLKNRVDGIEAIGGEPNVINKVQVNGKDLTITDKTVNVEVPTALSGLEGWTALDERVTAAKNQADKGVDEAGKANAAAATNAEGIADHETRIDLLETAKNEQASKITALEQADTAHAAEYETLNGIVTGHTATLATKADKTVVDGLLTKVSTNETAINTLNNTTLPALKTELNTEIGKKANSADVYTKTEIGTIAEGKTIVKMIEDAQTAASYDDSEVRGLINNNKTAIEAIYKRGTEGVADSGVLVNEIARVEGLLTAETNRATGAEAALSGRLDTVEAFWKEALRDEGGKNVVDTLKEIQDYIANDTTGATEVINKLNEHTERLDSIYVAAKGETPASGFLVTEIARVEGLIGANTQAIAAINHSTDGILAKAKEYTDNQIAAIPMATAALPGLVKASEEVTVAGDGTMGLGKVSTTKLYVPEGDELILNGGNA